MQGRSFSGNERHCCFLNVADQAGAGRMFANVSAVTGLDLSDDGRGLAIVDWDYDGDQDVWFTNRNGPQLKMMRNDIPPDHHFLMIRLVGNGTTSNRDAIGSRVELFLDGDKDLKSIRTLHAGEGYLSQSSRWLHFGLGDQTDIEKVSVRWPDGTVEEFSALEADHRYLLVQGSGEAKPWNVQASSSLKPSTEPVKPSADDAARIPVFTPIKMPPLPYTTFEGVQKRYAFGQNRPVLVNLWASWCQPCVAELKEWEKQATEIKAAGVDIIALAVDGVGTDTTDTALAPQLIDKLEFPFSAGRATPAMLDFIQALHDALIPLHRHFPIPTSFLIDREGRLSVIYKGPVGVDMLLQDIQLSGDSLEQRYHRSASLPGRILQHDVPLGIVASVEAEQRLAYGLVLSQRGLFEQAANEYQSVLEKWPESDRAYFRLANVLIRQRRPQQAIGFLEKVLQLKPDNVPAHVSLGKLYLRTGQADMASRHFDQAVKLRPTDTNLISQRGFSYMTAQQYELAMADYEKVVELAPKKPLSYADLAWLLATCPQEEFRNGKQALDYAQRACKSLEWKNFYTLDVLAAAYAELGQFDEAIHWQKVAIDHAPPKAKNMLKARLNLYQNHKPFRLGTRY